MRKKYSVIPEEHRKEEIPEVSPYVFDIITEASELLTERWEDKGFEPGPACTSQCFIDNRKEFLSLLKDKANDAGLTLEELSEELLTASSIMRSHALLIFSIGKFANE